MLQRVMPELMSMKNVLVMNDEAHHCYREKPESSEDTDSTNGVCFHPLLTTAKAIRTAWGYVSISR